MSDKISSKELGALKRLLAKRDYVAVKAGIERLRQQFGKHEILDRLEAEVQRRQGTAALGESKLEKRGTTTDQLRCPSCHKPVSITQRNTSALTCEACGAVLALDGGKLELLEGAETNRLSAPRWLLRLGQVGEYAGNKIQIVGRLSYAGTCSEWDSEDGRYYNEPWTYDEWVVLSERGTIFYIEESVEGFVLSEKFPQANPPEYLDFDMHYLSLHAPDYPCRIEEKGTYRVVGFEGEFSYTPSKEDRIRCLEYDIGNTYSVVWTETADKEVSEVEFYRSRLITRIELANIFGFDDYIAEWQALQEKKRAFAKLSYIPFGVALLLLIFIFGSLGRGTQVFSDSLVATQVAEGSEVGPFTLDAKGRVHSIYLNTAIADNSSLWVGAELLDANRDAINVAEGDFWRESGRDSDGPWSERFTTTFKYFRLTKPGQYFLRVFAETPPGRTINSTAKVKVAVYERAGIIRYYVVALILSLIFGVSLRVFHSVKPFGIVFGVVFFFCLFFGC